MFDTLNELASAIENQIGENWSDGDVEFVTPDGKRWRIRQFLAVCNPTDTNDVLECRLVEMKPPGPVAPVVSAPVSQSAS